MSKKCYCGNEKLIYYSETYYVCDNCHTLVSKADIGEEVQDVQNEDSDLYGSNYWKKNMLEMSGVNSLDEVVDYYIKDRVPYWIQYILKYIPVGSKVAEIGCGLGQLAYVMKTIGYKQKAYELSPEICHYIENDLGVNMHCGGFGELQEKYDAILAFDLFEHIPNPKEFLTTLYHSLPEQGVLCIQMPNFDYSLSYGEMKEKKPRFELQLKEKEHLFLYSKESIEMLLREVGFQSIIFEPPCFGDDYDMFFFAGKGTLQPLIQRDIDEQLNGVNAGRIVKALCRLNTEKKELEERLSVIESDSLIRLEIIEDCNEKLQKQEKVIEACNRRLTEREHLLQESEKDRNARLDVIENCHKKMREQEEIIATCGQKVAECEAALLEKEDALIESEKECAAMSKIVESCNERLKEQERIILDYNQRLMEIEQCNKKIREQDNIIAEYKLKISAAENLLEELRSNNNILFEKNNNLNRMLDVYQTEVMKKKKQRGTR